VLIFKCKCVDNNSVVGTNDLDFTLVDINKMSYIAEPFTMASQVGHIFYVTDLANQKWPVVYEGRSMHKNHDEDSLNTLEITSFSSRTIQDKVDGITDDIHAIQSEHNKDIWEK